MDYGGWYDIDTKEKDFREIQSIRFVAAMGPPGGGRTFITQRYVRHFSVVYVEPYSTDSLKSIFSNIMDWFLLQPTIPAFPKSMQGMRDSLVSCTIVMYEKVST
jgi:dynein heavy chain